MNNTRFFLRHKAVKRYITVYLAAIAVLVAVGINSVKQGGIDTTVLIIAGVILVGFSLLFIKEIKKGVFDQLEIVGDSLALVRLNKRLPLRWDRVESVEVAAAEKVRDGKRIIIHFKKNSSGEKLDITLDYSDVLLKEIKKHKK